MSKKKPASVYTAVRIRPELRERAQARATQQGRSLGNYIKFLISRDLGIAVEEEPPSYSSKKKAAQK